MIGFIQKRIEELADSVISPVWQWVMLRSWRTRAALLLTASLCLSAFYWPATVRDRFTTARYAASIALAKDNGIPLDTVAAESSRLRLGRLTRTVQNDLGAHPGEASIPWVIAGQVVGLGLAGQPMNDKLPFAAYMRRYSVDDCFCWRQLPKEPGQVGVFISGWVIAAFAELRVPVTMAELDSVIAIQDRKGWWPLYLGLREERYASTYSTALITLGLVRLQDAGLVPTERRKAVADAIRAGTTWLLTVRTTEARWKLYPNKPDSRMSDAVSGLIVHVLHQAKVKDLQPIDRAWLESLPSPVDVEAAAVEHTFEEMFGQDNTAIDNIVQLTVPWTLVSTVDAYEEGTIEQKAKAVAWVQAILEGSFMAKIDRGTYDWYRSEALYALAYVHAHPLMAPTSAP